MSHISFDSSWTPASNVVQFKNSSHSCTLCGNELSMDPISNSLKVMQRMADIRSNGKCVYILCSLSFAVIHFSLTKLQPHTLFLCLTVSQLLKQTWWMVSKLWICLLKIRFLFSLRKKEQQIQWTWFDLFILQIIESLFPTLFMAELWCD